MALSWTDPRRPTRRATAIVLALSVALATSARAADVTVTVDPTPPPAPRIEVRMPDAIAFGHSEPGNVLVSDPFVVSVSANVAAVFVADQTALASSTDSIAKARVLARIDGGDAAPADGLTVARFGADGGSAEVRVVLVLQVPDGTDAGRYAGQFEVRGEAID